MNEMTNTVAIVTGGSSGIGAQTALRLAERGHSVVITGRNRDRLDQVASRTAQIVAIRADMADSRDLEALVEQTVERFGRIDILINNAGMFTAGPFEELEVSQLQRIFEINVIGPAVLSRLCVPYLGQSDGAIVNVSSTMAHKAVPGVSAYAASKAALEQLTRNLAVELGPRGIRVNAVAPGPTLTPILERAGFTREMIAASNAQLTAQMPLGRLGNPDEVARWIVELADSPTWVTGQVLSVDGGLAVA